MRRVAAVVAMALLVGCAGTADEEPDAGDGGATSSPAASSPAAAADLEAVETFEDLSHDHVRGSVAYPETPPVGGPHNARWLACGGYGEPVPPEAAVHSMEHGAVWITYRPGLDAAGVAGLTELAEIDEEYVLVSPYDEELPAPVVASSWGVQLRADGPNDPRLRLFVERYAGGDQGGEPGAPCRTDGLTLEQARDVVENG
ncbi:MAG: DUF3105 domain-containing protein [Actinomycetes bacterium]